MSLRNQIKHLAGALCSVRPLHPFVSSRHQDSVNVVYYHFVGSAAPHYEAFYSGCTVERFARDLEQLSRVFDFASLAEVIGTRPRTGSGTKPIVAVTFDDGLDLGRTPVRNVLRRFGVQATTFVITSCVDNARLMWRHKLSAVKALVSGETCVAEYNAIADRESLPRIRSACQLLDASRTWDARFKDSLATELWERCNLLPISDYLSTQKPYFSWQGLSDWMDDGHSVGFHTHTHPYCSRVRPEEINEEIIEPARALKTRLGLKDLCLSYPFGDRLALDRENELLAQGEFTALFGIGGLRKRGASAQRLERAGIEEDGVPWAVFARAFIPGSECP